MSKRSSRKRSFHKTAVAVLSLSLAVAGTIAIPSGASAATVNTSQPKASATHDGKAIKSLQGSNGATLIALRDVVKLAGAKLAYDGKAHVVTVSEGSNSAVYSFDSDSVVVKLNGSSIGDRYQAKTIKGVSYVQVEAFTVPFAYRVMRDNASGAVELSREGQNDIMIAAGKLSSAQASNSIKVNIIYPIVSGLENSTAEQAINGALQAYADLFLKTAEAAIAKSDGPAQNASYEFYTDYQITYNRDGVVSFLLGQYTYLGGASGFTGQEGMTFALRDGQVIELGDLLQADKQANATVKALIEARVERDAEEKGYTLEDFKDWTKGIASYLDHFYLTDNGVTILIPLTEGAPSALDVLEFSFSWSELLKGGANPLGAYGE